MSGYMACATADGSAMEGFAAFQKRPSGSEDARTRDRRVSGNVRTDGELLLTILQTRVDPTTSVRDMRGEMDSTVVPQWGDGRKGAVSTLTCGRVGTCG